MNTIEWITIILLITFWIIVFCTEIKSWRNRVPDGKTFIEKFYFKITDIMYAQTLAEMPYIKVKINNKTLRVYVKKDDVPEGLTYRTIPKYESYSIYIENKLVCRVHKLEINFKWHKCVEFSIDRSRDEIIKIINATHAVAKDLTARSLKSHYVTKSFFNEDK